MKKYQVGKIKFGFSYNYDKYFYNNVSKYLINDDQEVNHLLKCLVVDDIKFPEGNLIGNKNPYFIINDDFNYQVIKTKTDIKVLIKYDKEYREVIIYLNKHLLKDLVETEYVLSGLMFLEICMYNNYLPVHSSAISINDQGLLFMGPSGVGKSTHRRFWQETCEDTVVINDDKPILVFEGNQINIISSFFAGAERLNNNIITPLKAIILLKQGSTNKVTKYSGKDIIPLIINNLLRPNSEALWDNILPLIGILYENIPVYQLEATKSLDASISLFKFLSKEGVLK